MIFLEIGSLVVALVVDIVKEQNASSIKSQSRWSAAFFTQNL